MKVDRLVSILLILLEKERVGAQELADLFEVSPRTIYRDIDAIGMAGIPVRAVSGVGGGFEIMEHYKIDKQVFSAADLSVIMTGLSSLSGLMRGDELLHALTKVKSIFPADRAEEIEQTANQILIDWNPWLGSQNGQRDLERIRQAMQERRLLSFTYTDTYGTKTVRTIEPYQLVRKGNHWYCQGYCLTRNDFRLFRLSRVSNLQILEETFAPREHPKPQLDFSDLLPSLQTTIKLRVHASVLDRVLDFCSAEDVSPDGGAYSIVRFPFIENDYYYGILLSFGEQCECLEPSQIRLGLKRRIHALAALYERTCAE